MRGGTFPVLPTIFRADGSIDEVGCVAVADFVLACGVDGIAFPGLASEYDHLTRDERLALVSAFGRVAQERGAALIVGGSAAEEAETMTMLEAAREAGAAAAMVMTPHRHDTDLNAHVAFYRRAAERGVPIMLQNAPRPMGVGLAPAQIRAIVAATPGVAFVKEETMPCGHGISALLALRPASLRGVFGGAGGRYIIDELGRGAIGTMPAAELPEISVALIAAHRAGDVHQMRDLHERMLPVLMMQAIFRWDLTKEVLRRRGLIRHGHVRAPGPRLDAVDHRELGALLDRLAPLLTKSAAEKIQA
ncbi:MULTISPECIES: dihydrodipicolinate synthase family protein [unclassified Sphingomonas]|uniref:dihydrodipicolinate synthase family protein n=1 Tax=unclassified Sphingomonas TaxID=196159 RepID=UPI001E339E64|nr:MULTISPECIES: dihydrodipicolinate synthase family protein [unclassified Sphingomonas]